MSVRKTIEEFIEQSIKVHGNTYDYSLVEYVSNSEKVKIICKKHGVFEQTPKNHLKGHDCLKCKYDKLRYEKSEFIEKCKQIHNNFYDYSLVEYKNIRSKIKIICPVHGVFEQRSSNHLNGNLCWKCKINNQRNNAKDFIYQSNQIHNNFYDYSLVKYKGVITRVKIICPIHGVFEQFPLNHLKGGCNKCGKESLRVSQEYFINMAKNIHDNKYDYSIVDYKNSATKVKIICPIHGIFEQTPNSHTSAKQGCYKCYDDKRRNDTEEFIKSAKETHGEIYDYSLVKIKIICKEHGMFEQTPDSHIRLKSGCPKCKVISKQEKNIIKILDSNKIEYSYQKTFEDCKNKIKLRFDFFIPSINTCIEYDGDQHFKSIKIWGGENGLLYRLENDKIKEDYCALNNIRLERITKKDDLKEKLIKLIQI